MTEQDKQALIKHFCSRDCGEAAEGCTIMPCHEIELIQEFPTTDTDSDTISRAKAIEALKQQAEAMSEWSNRYAEQRKGVLTAVNIVEDLPPAQPEQLEQCPIYGGMCAYPSDQCYDCPRHAGAKMEVTT